MNRPPSGRFKALGSLFTGSLIWVALAFLVLAIFLFTTIRVGRVTGEEVGVMLNKINGNITIIEQSGVKIYNGITNAFFILDKTLQTIEMAGGVAKGQQVGNNLKVKTIDGSDVFVDLKVQYRINAEAADLIVTTSGIGDAYKYKWAQDYIRSLCRNYLGELTTEEFYDAEKRKVKIVAAHKEINQRLDAYGIQIDSIVIPKRPVFYQEYEEMIKKKKLADQAVLEEQSKALAAKQRQHRILVEETNEKNVAVESFKGKMEQIIIAAQAEAEKATKAADAYYDRVTIGAEAALYQGTKNAEGILARKKAEAEGIEALKKALEGEGGLNMVKLEYAKKLKDVMIAGQPITIERNIQRFEHLYGPASAARAGQEKEGR